MEINLKVNKVYIPYLQKPQFTQIYYGGSSSGKSFFLCQKIIIDNNRVNKEKPSFTLEDHFEVYRVDVMSERYKNIMHRKFCVIDLEVAMHGTFNWTNAANYNKEHWDVDHNRETAKTFAEEFVKMRRDAELSMLWLDF